MVRIQKVTTPMELREWWKNFMVHLARAVKDAQMDERHCYHCSSPEHFIRNCPLMKTARDKKQLNGKEGTDDDEGSLDPSKKPWMLWRAPKSRLRRHKVIPTDSLLESRPISMMVWHGECSQGEDKLRKLHSPPRQWGTGKNCHPEVCKRTFPTSGANNWPYGF